MISNESYACSRCGSSNITYAALLNRAPNMIKCCDCQYEGPPVIVESGADDKEASEGDKVE